MVSKARDYFYQKFQILYMPFGEAHQEDLTCFTCGFKLKGRGYKIGGNTYCEIDFKRKFAPRCEECSDFIIGVCAYLTHLYLQMVHLNFPNMMNFLNLHKIV